MKPKDIQKTVIKRFTKTVLPFFAATRKEFLEFLSFFISTYVKKKVSLCVSVFEHNKNTLVRRILLRRGRVNRMFLHLSAMAVLSLGVVLSPLVSNSPFFSDGENRLLSFAQEPLEVDLVSDDVFE